VILEPYKKHMLFYAAQYTPLLFRGPLLR
jgi:hypothetical protein